MSDFLYVVNRDHSSKVLSFWENRVLLYAFWRQTYKRTDVRTDKQMDSPNALSRLPLTSDECHQLAIVRRSCMYKTWRSNCWQHAMKPDIGGESRLLPTPPAFETPFRGLPVGLLLQRLARKNWNGLATRRWRNFEDVITRFDTIHERDRQQRRDGRTDTARGGVYA